MPFNLLTILSLTEKLKIKMKTTCHFPSF